MSIFPTFRQSANTPPPGPFSQHASIKGSRIRPASILHFQGDSTAQKAVSLARSPKVLSENSVKETASPSNTVSWGNIALKWFSEFFQHRKKPKNPLIKTVYKAVISFVFQRTVRSWLGESKEAQTTRLKEQLWQKHVAPWIIKQPDTTKQYLRAWQAELAQSADNPLLKEIYHHLFSTLIELVDQPTDLRILFNLIIDVLQQGGAERVKKLIGVFMSKQYQEASAIEKGKLFAEASGPLMLKILQTLSTIPGLFPESAMQAMQQLYENTTPETFSKIQPIIEQELGKPIKTLYDWFNPKPLKAGSIAQVYQAILETGEEVAVKVVKPESEKALNEDLGMLTPLAQLCEQIFPGVKANQLLNEFQNLLQQECDMRIEAGRLVKLKQHFKYDNQMQVPTVYPSHSSQHVLTMAFLHGKNLTHFKGEPEVADAYFSMILRQIFEHGACQADPHPANLPYNQPLKRFNFLDAGLAYFVSPAERRQFAKLLVALYSGNVELIAKSLVSETFSSNSSKGKPVTATQLKALTQQLQPLYETHLKTAQIKGDQLLQFLALATLEAEKLGIPTSTSLPLLWKTLLTAIGVTLTIDPNFPLPQQLCKKLGGYLIQEEPKVLLKEVPSLLSRYFGGV